MSLFQRRRTLYDRAVQDYKVRIIGFAPNGGTYTTYAQVGQHQKSPVFLNQGNRWWWSYKNEWLVWQAKAEQIAKFEQALADVQAKRTACVPMPQHFYDDKAYYTTEHQAAVMRHVQTVAAEHQIGRLAS
jgi:hypothetical protein